jgi:hypothetical protein
LGPHGWACTEESTMQQHDIHHMLRKIIAAAGSFCVGLLIARAIGL